MNRKRRKQLIREIKCSVNHNGNLAYIVTFIQKQPWTCVRVIYQAPDGRYPIGIGFSKVCPDVWDAGFGKELAICKAAAHIVKQLDERRPPRRVPPPVFEPLDVRIKDDDPPIVGEDWVGPTDSQMNQLLSLPDFLQPA